MKALSTQTTIFKDLFDESQTRYAKARNAFLLSLCMSTMVTMAILLWRYSSPINYSPASKSGMTVILAGALVFASIVTFRRWIKLRDAKKPLERFLHCESIVHEASRGNQFQAINRALQGMQELAKTNRLAAAFMRDQSASVIKRSTLLKRKALNEELKVEKDRAEQKLRETIRAKKRCHPIKKAKSSLEESIQLLKNRRHEIDEQWNAAIKQASWWTQLTAEGPNFRQMDEHIRKLEAANIRFNAKYGAEVLRIDFAFDRIQARAKLRIDAAVSNAETWIAQVEHHGPTPKHLLSTGMWCSAMSIPVSIWGDLINAGSVYDAMRAVNSNFAGMSDFEIWMDTLVMQPESLAGLISLTKGAYFEQLVAGNTGGDLFEHFNHPETDITIDGVDFQLKATDSVSYVESVPDHIPVIATTEVAAQSDAIDSGISNAELSQSIELAVGGSVIDVGDSAADAIISGIGGIGLFASIAGINHYAKQVENGGDQVEAAFEGLGVAITGTVKAAVDLAEMGHKVVMSRPSRFIGRQIKKAAIKLDDKLMGN